MPERKVKAAVMTDFNRIEIQYFPYPAVAPEGALVRMKMCGICGTDKHLFVGMPPAPLFVKTPLILGHENLGIIEEIGAVAKTKMAVQGGELSPGDRVTWYAGILCGECYHCRFFPSNYPGTLCLNAKGYGQNLSAADPPHLFGGYAEFCYLLPGVWVYRIPNDMSDEVAVLTDVFAATIGVRKGMMPSPVLKEGFGPGDTVVIQGSGPIGMAAGITARLAGAYRIILVGGMKARLKIADELGVFDHIVDIGEIPDNFERAFYIASLTPHGYGADMVVECAGIPDAVPEGLAVLRRGGTFIELGNFLNTGSTTINPFTDLCFKNVTLLGQWSCPPQSFDVALKLMEMAMQRGIPLEKMVTHRFAIEQAEEALNTNVYMKGVIVPA
jgi:L-iditol 2-dehydrogenase